MVQGNFNDSIAWMYKIAAFFGLPLLIGLSWLVNQPTARSEWFGALWLRGVLLAVWIGLVIWTAWWLTRPVGPWLKVLTSGLLLSLLIGILLPPELLRAVIAGLLALMPSDATLTGRVNVPALGHFALFAGLAVLLFVGRADLGAWRLLGVLAGLAVATELMQFFVDGRQPDWRDVLIDMAGVGTGAIMVAIVGRLR